MGLIRRPRAIPEFALSALPNGVGGLDPYLIINSVAYSPNANYKFGDASLSGLPTWFSGIHNMTLYGTGVACNDGSPLLGSCDDSCLFNGVSDTYYRSGYSISPSSSDWILEIIFKMGTSGVLANCLNAVYISEGEGPGYYPNGWYCYVASNDLIFTLCKVSGVVASSATIRTTALEVGTWYHAVIVINQSESAGATQCKIFINSTDFTDTRDDFNALGSVTTGGIFEIGNIVVSNLASSPYTSNIAYMSVWKYSDMIVNSEAGMTEIETITQERFQQLTGAYPNLAQGTATPTTIARNYPAYITKYNADTGHNELYRVGPNWLRQERFERD